MRAAAAPGRATIVSRRGAAPAAGAARRRTMAIIPASAPAGRSLKGRALSQVVVRFSWTSRRADETVAPPAQLGRNPDSTSVPSSDADVWHRDRMERLLENAPFNRKIACGCAMALLALAAPAGA